MVPRALASTPFNSSHFNMISGELLAAGIQPGRFACPFGLEAEDALQRTSGMSRT